MSPSNVSFKYILRVETAQTATVHVFPLNMLVLVEGEHTEKY